MDLTSLNEQQKKAVLKKDGPILVMAGAGSGKTRVLTTRVAYLIEQGVSPYNILAITFTNKAAKEMKERIYDLIGDNQIQVSTFHSFGLRLIRENYQLLGYNKNFTIIDSDDSNSIIKKILKELNIDENVKSIKNAISSNKNELITPFEYEKYVQTDFDEVVLKVYERYERKLKQSNCVDFDDLLLLPIMLFRKEPEVLKKAQEKYKYILIDEYQDTNEAQYILAKMISAKYKNICVVGDDSQSIYSWRGSNYKNILNFEKDYPDCEVILLEQNYRSTKKIIESSNILIKNNTVRKDKNLWTLNSSGEDIVYYQAINEIDEARYVVNQIHELLNKGEKLSEIAVLYRTNAQSQNFEKELLLSNIPYKIVGSFYFYNRREIKDLMCYLKLIYNTYDDHSLLRIINVPKRKIGKVTIENLVNKANLENKPIYEVINSGKELEFKKLIEHFREIKDELTLTQLVDLVLEESGLREEIINSNELESELRLENLEEFKTITSQFEEKYGIISLEEFLAEVSLVSDISEYRNNDNAVTLMTIHLAKGLEFNNVFVVGLEEGLFPHFNAVTNSEIEEERRLCYVAITRAKKRLFLVNALKRTLYGITKENPISRFINELNLKAENVKRKTNSKLNEVVDDSVSYEVGEHIKFDLYGEGVIVGISDKIITVAFKHPHGIKTLIKGHKNIRKV